jgi:hypothetical protein
MDLFLGALGELVLRLQWLPPTVPLCALAVFVAAWIAARRAMRRPRPSRAIELIRVWAAMLALSCVILLVDWAITRGDPADASPGLWNVAQALLVAAVAAPVHAVRTTLLRFIGRPGDGGGSGAEWLRRVAWAVFASLAMLGLHTLAMGARFPWGGGEFHSMFAYTQEGRIDVAHLVWRWSVGILGAAAIIFAAWIPLRWWVTALMACAVGMWHWWYVVTWRFPVTRYFHQTAIVLFVALPFAVLAIAAAGAGIRRVAVRRRGVARTSGES